MRPRVVLFTRKDGRERLRAILDEHGADVVLAEDERDFAEALGRDALAPIAGVIVDLDPSPRASGIGALLAARAHAPVARRVLVARRGSIVDAALAAGVIDRVLPHLDDPYRLSAIAAWLVALCDHAPRRLPETEPAPPP